MILTLLCVDNEMSFPGVEITVCLDHRGVCPVAESSLSCTFRGLLGVTSRSEWLPGVRNMRFWSQALCLPCEQVWSWDRAPRGTWSEQRALGRLVLLGQVSFLGVMDRIAR